MKKVIILLFLVWSGSVLAAQPTPAKSSLYPTSETTNAATVYMGTRQHRSAFTINFKTSNVAGKTVYDLTASGKGAYDKYKNATWTIASQLIPDGDFIKPIWTRTEIHDLVESRTITLMTQFDYAKKRITITENISGRVQPKTFVFPIKGRTVDYASLHYFLKPFIANLPQEKGQNFYLLTIEPALYKVNIKYQKTEKLEFTRQPRTAIKIRLIADFGMLDEVLDRMVPPTFIWYENLPPYHWLQYQGLESGLHSPNIFATIMESP